MTAHNYLYLIATVVAVIGWGTWACAEDDVTVISTPAATSASSQKTADSDGTPVVHKSLHKKKHSAVASGAAASSTPTLSTASASSATAETKPIKKTATADMVATHAQTAAVPTSTTSVKSVPDPRSPAAGPTVETGLPVARYPGMGAPIRGVSTYLPIPVALPPTKSVAATTTPQPYFASVLPSSVIPLTSAAAGSFSSPSRSTSPTPDFVFTNFSKKVKNTYPWKTNIVTTMFYIGEGSTPISSTTNVMSSWDEDWLSKNHGTDSPNNRNGYASGNHASTLNPFYVALPFNDLAFPDKARRWLPPGWYRRPRDGKQVSACKDRWVEIKNQRGDYCYAQWEDVGPLRYDHAEYVFGDERPIGLGGDHAGLDVSPAVAQCLRITDRNHITSWRFVDDEDVRPGPWLTLDEQAVLYTALHQLKSFRSSPDLPIQRAAEPIDDSSNVNSNKKKVDAAKG